MTAFAIPNEASAMPQAGDEQRFLAFLESQQRTLYKVAYVYCRDPEERRDLVQEMAIQLWRSFAQFDERAAVSTWTYRVAMNVAISHRRREGRRIRETLPLDFAFDVADETFGADSEQSNQLRALVDGLDEMSRALVLFYLEGFDHSEIAELLGTTASNVSTRLNRIRAKLQSQAKEYIHGPR
jgi:RNA polymerase sigma-70 factor (ECF subfamily)